MGDHTETIQIDYDPSQISYKDLLQLFWRSHRPTRPAWSRQYMSAVFVHDETQRQAAEEIKASLEAKSGQQLHTEILPAGPFYLAEDYHQKYALRAQRKLAKEFEAIYPVLEDFVNSTAVSRANGFASGYGSMNLLTDELESYGLSPEGQQTLVNLAKRYY